METDNKKDLYKKILELQKATGGTVYKDAVNPHFRSSYTSLGSLKKYLNPYLVEIGLLLRYKSEFREINGQQLWVLVTSVCDVETGQEIESVWPKKIDQKSQAMGSENTYSQRYATLEILGLASDDDDDGNRSSGISVNTDKKAEAPEEKPELPKQIQEVFDKATSLKTQGNTAEITKILQAHKLLLGRKRNPDASPSQVSDCLKELNYIEEVASK